MKKIHKILISQPRPQVERNPYSEMEAQYGVEFDFQPLTRVESISLREFRDKRIYLEEYTAVILNSRLAIDQFFHMCAELRYKVPVTLHYYCISDTVGNYLQKYIEYRKRRIFAAPDNQIEGLLPFMNRRPEEKYLFITSEGHNDDIINRLAAKNIQVQPAAMYRTVAEKWQEDKPFDYDMVVLFTPLGVTALKENFPDLNPNKVAIAAFGATTIAAVEQAGWSNTIVAPTPECPSIIKAIENYLNHK